MPKTYISLDLETTGLEPGSDAIIEIGALRFEGERVLDTFSSFVNPGRKIPRFITELTGITDDDVKYAPGVHLISSQLVEFVGRAPIIGHNIGFDLAFLRRHGLLQNNGSLDTFELAGILVPHAGRYSLESLVHTLGIHSANQTHRALDDARLTHSLFVELMKLAAQLSPQTLKEIIRLGDRIHWSPSRFFSDVLFARNRQGFTGGIGAQLSERKGIKEAGPLFIDQEKFTPLSPRDEPIHLDLDALTALFDEDGPIAETFTAYEYRNQQIEMLQAVGQAFNEAHHLFVEAGTGTGKSVAYLIPAIEWSVLNGQHVVVSTNTINLQDQLANKDIPELAQALYDFRYQVLKGRSHYLCRQQFETLRRRGPSNTDEMRVLAKVFMWLPTTVEGDGDGIFLPTAYERAIWHSISAATEACDPERCRFFQSDRCFFYGARAKAEGANLLIVNHALLLADIAAQNRVLPEYDLLIIDEAHHLESATTESLRYSVSWQDINRTLDDLLVQNRAYPNLLDQIMQAAETLPRKMVTTLHSAIVRLQDAGERTQRYLDSLFTDIEIYLQEQAGRANRYGMRFRLTPRIREEGAWSDIELQWAQVAPHYNALLEGLAIFQGAFDDPILEDEPEFQRIRVRLLGITRFVGTAHSQLKSFIAQPAQNMIYWIESRNNRPTTLNAAPLHVGAMIQEHLLDKKRSIIFTSATLRVQGSFAYMRDRLGVDNAQELAVGSPFDYQSAALVYIPSNMPEPNSHGYQKAVEETLIDLLKATQGRALVLFTSYSQLTTTTQAITAPLSKQGITVFAQGSGSSRAQLLENFRKGEKVVLLGTRSFWEGVDVPGEALSCLVIVKLPFDVPNDPIVAARGAGYDNAFSAYMVPEAILRFLQGFGRLIRTATDQGIVVVLDRRLLTKRYGSRFIDSLPDPLVHLGRRSDLPLVAERWLAGEPLPNSVLADPFTDEPWEVPPPEEPSDEDPAWFWGA